MTKNDRVIVSFPLDVSEIAAIAFVLAKGMKHMAGSMEEMGIPSRSAGLACAFTRRLLWELKRLESQYSADDLQTLIENGCKETVPEAEKCLAAEVPIKTPPQWRAP